MCENSWTQRVRTHGGSESERKKGEERERERKEEEEEEGREKGIREREKREVFTIETGLDGGNGRETEENGDGKCVLVKG